MEDLTKLTYTTSRDLCYTYYDRPAAEDGSELPALLLLHGFPDSAQLWSAIIPQLSHLPHRIIVPDLLGFGNTSKPTDPALYNSRSMAGDIAELLTASGVGKFVSIGHDLGAFLAQRMWLWHAERVAGLVLLNVAYSPPDLLNGFDLEAALAASEKAYGYPLYAYLDLFTADDGAAVLDAHLESFWCVLHGDNGAHWMRDMFCVRGALRRFLESDGRVPLKFYAQPGAGWKDEWFATVEKGGFAGQMCWYKAMAGNHHFNVEKTISPERVKVTVPTLFLGCPRDEVCLISMIESSVKRGLLPDLKVQEIDAAHWCTMEKPAEVGSAMLAFLTERFC